MARPIPFDAPVRDAKLELQHKLERAPAEHAAALLDAYEVLQALHDSKVIDTLRGFIASGETVLDIGVKGALGPDSIRAMRNGLMLFNLMGSIEPETLKKFTQPIPQSIQLSAVKAETPGLWGLMKSSIFDKDFRRGLAAMIGILRSIGSGLAGKSGSSPE